MDFFDRTGVWGRGQGGLWVNPEVRGVGHNLQVAVVSSNLEFSAY